MRPKQWTKNLLVFAAVVFAGEFLQFHSVFESLLAFFCFSFIASAVYILNDYMDIEKDRLHPEKSKRPLASGELKKRTAVIVGIVLFSVSMIGSYFIHPLFCAILGFYFIVNIFYSFWLKHVVIIDVMLIALGFVLRAVSGAVVIEAEITSWFMLCTMLLALFLALSKRRHELQLFAEDPTRRRRVLNHYSRELLDQLISIVTSATIMSYSVYTATAEPHVYMMWTIPLVIYGIFRYLYLVHMKDGGGSPERVLLDDKHILTTVALYAISVMLIKVLYNS